MNIYEPTLYMFRVYRASLSYYSVTPPCEEAIESNYIITDTRVFASPEAYDERLVPHGSKPWLSEGTNHRIINGMISRDTGWEKGWLVRFSTLHQLMGFIKKYGDCVVGEKSITIYDTDTY